MALDSSLAFSLGNPQPTVPSHPTNDRHASIHSIKSGMLLLPFYTMKGSVGGMGVFRSRETLRGSLFLLDFGQWETATMKSGRWHWNGCKTSTARAKKSASSRTQPHFAKVCCMECGDKRYIPAIHSFIRSFVQR